MSFFIFYDGINDSFSAFQNRMAGIPQNEVNRRVEFNARKSVLLSAKNLLLNSATFTVLAGLQRRIERKWLASLPQGAIKDSSAVTEDALSDMVIDAYGSNVSFVEKLAEAFHFKAIFYWQPSLFGNFPSGKSPTSTVQPLSTRKPDLPWKTMHVGL